MPFVVWLKVCLQQNSINMKNQKLSNRFTDLITALTYNILKLIFQVCICFSNSAPVQDTIWDLTQIQHNLSELLFPWQLSLHL